MTADQLSFWDPTVIITTIFALLLFSYWYGTTGFSVLQRLKVPGPKPIPFVGNILDVRKYGSVHLMMLDYAKKYGKVFAVSLGRKPSLVVADPEMLKSVMVKDFMSFHNRMIPLPPPPMNANVFSARDETWRRIRNILTPSFSSKKMKLMVPLIEESCDIFLKELDQIADTGKRMILSIDHDCSSDGACSYEQQKCSSRDVWFIANLRDMRFFCQAANFRGEKKQSLFICLIVICR